MLRTTLFSTKSSLWVFALSVIIILSYSCHNPVESVRLKTTDDKHVATLHLLDSLEIEIRSYPFENREFAKQLLDSLHTNSYFKFRLKKIIGFSYAYEFAFDSAKLWVDQSLLHADSAGWKEDFALLINRWVNILTNYNATSYLPDISLQETRDLLDLTLHKDDPRYQELYTMTNINLAFSDIESSGKDYASAFGRLYENIELFAQGYNPQYQIYNSYILGYFLNEVGDIDRSREVFQKLIETCADTCTEMEFVGRSVQYLGILDARQGDSVCLVYYAKRAVEIFNKIGKDGKSSISVIPPLYDILADALKNKRNAEADSLFHLIDSLVASSPDPFHKARFSVFQAQKSALNKDYKQAISQLRQAVKVDSAFYVRNLVDENLHQYYAAENDYAKAYQILRRYHNQYKESVNEDRIRSTEQMRTRAMLKEKERETEAIRRLQSLQKEKIKTQNILLISIGISFCLLLLFVWYQLRSSRALSKAHYKLRNQASELAKAKAQAEAASKAKADFLSVMSHEIRTPLNAVVGITNLLSEENPRENQRDSLQTLSYSSQHLLSLINDILDYSKIESGKLTLEHTDFNLEQLVANLSQTFQFKAEERGIEVRKYYDEKLPIYFKGDPVRLGQILSNLLSNAVKFTENGYVELRVETAKTGALKISVIDTGIGINKEQQIKIFEEFSQASTDTTRKYGGTGLGLSISKRLLELMGSQIQLSSVPGQGSSFFFYLNLPIANNSQLPGETFVQGQSDPLEMRSIRGMKILLVEDNLVNQKIAMKYLNKWEAIVSVANNGQEALNKVAEESFDLILMDMRMPVMDGLEATRKIRDIENSDQAGIPILALTASAMQDEIKEMYDAGVNGIVPKPFDPKDLFQQISRLRVAVSR